METTTGDILVSLDEFAEIVEEEFGTYLCPDADCPHHLTDQCCPEMRQLRKCTALRLAEAYETKEQLRLAMETIQ